MNPEVRVLVVDDDQEEFIIIRELIRRIPRNHLQLEWTGDYSEALKRLRSRNYDIYLIDQVLGKETGISLVRRAIAEGVTEPMILLTGYPDFDMEALEAGASDYLVKGDFNAQTLIRCIHYNVSRKQTEAELRRACLEAESADRSKSDFIATISHELKNPIVAIGGLLDLAIKKEEVVKNPDLSQDIRLMRESVVHVSNLLQDLLSISQLKANQVSFNPMECSPKVVLQEAAELLRLQAESKGLTIEIKVDNNIPQVIHVDKTRVWQILVNLIGNAIKFTQEGYVRAYLSKAELDNTEYLKFEVVDSGIGFDVEDQDKIFEPFQQLNHSDQNGTVLEKGSGLGLTICKLLAEKLGGFLNVESSKGKGSTFQFYLPSVANPSLQTSREYINSQSGNRPIVVVADEDFISQRILSFYLRGEGVEIVTLDSGDALLQFIQKNHVLIGSIKLVFVNLTFLHYQQSDLLNGMRSHGYLGPVIGLTECEVNRSLDPKNYDCEVILPKPVTQQQIKFILQGLL
ncbi:Hypothetical protein PBC10988_8870 [Planctomycetales bacterium 10988]|nr:Hypothetical protein PBC10988_8870 [Planctomycetales bacterium 10988]